MTTRNDRIGIAALILAWLGLWGAWISQRVVSLRQNALDFAEWSTFLPTVRSGEIILMPEVLRLGVALAVIALAVASSSLPTFAMRAGVRALAFIPGFLLLPPYPFTLQLWWSDSYGWRFTAASIALAGVAASFLLDRLAERRRRMIVLLLSVIGAILAAMAYAVLRQPFAVLYNHALWPGWGMLAFMVGLIIAAVMQINLLITQTRTAKQTGQ
jgi:hypothetical protein